MLLRRLRGVKRTLWLLPVLTVAACNRTGPTVPASTEPVAQTVAASPAQVHAFCGSCHAYPPPDSFPSSYWPDEVAKGYHFYDTPTPESQEVRRKHIRVPPLNRVVRYYQDRAPAELPLPVFGPQPSPAPVRFAKAQCPIPGQLSSPAVSNVNLVHLSDARKLDLLACDMRQNRVLAMKPYEPTPRWRVLAEVPNPCHTEVVDLDGDGIPDILVACLGNFSPTDNPTGRVVWLRGRPDGTYQPVTLLSGVGRVADVQAADFNGDGKLDLVVGVFGWQTTGEILYLENQTTDWSKPKFMRHVLDARHGTIHVPVCDLNGDGKPDFVALISQEHETVVAFLNDGHGGFRKETIYTAPHPAYGSTGIQLVDLDGDGKLDVLYTNGDILDQPYLLKPYHGIHWLRNEGTYPFKDQLLTPMCGVHRAVAADFRGTGRLDIVAVSFLPKEAFPDRAKHHLDSVIYLEQTSPGHFVRHSLETVTCDHATCAAGAWNSDGKVHFVTGNFCLSENVRNPISVTLWKNLGRLAR
ncbi:MAG TPA: FG-GAP-like repeat-containing protein [Gemmataceae bacterium]|nr:FG-GAP-like repeat-containing protein [Gemmataceae bacterium]